MKEIFFEIMQDVLEDKILYGYKAEDAPNELIKFPRGSGKQSRINESIFEDQMNNLSKAFELAGKSVLDSSRVWENWVYDSGVQIEVDRYPLISLYTEEDKTSPKTRQCNRCSNMKKKELKRYDSCPECGRSLFALKGRGW